MEKNSSGVSPTEAASALDTLTEDRARLASRVEVPRTLMAAFGGVAAWWVASAASTSPGEHYEPPTSGWLALVGALIITHLLQRETGLRLRSVGARAGWALAGILAACLALFSVSLGLVSLGLPWAVALTALVAFVTTTWLAGLAYRSALEELRRD